MQYTEVTLIPLAEDDREQFIIENQWAFKHGAMIEFGLRDDHLEDEGEIISRSTIEHSIDEKDNETYRIMLDGKKMGGVILKIDKETHHNHLEILFVTPEAHGKGIGFGAWKAVEALHPETRIWETCTPYFEKRNIHFYVNKCGFQINAFYGPFRKWPDMPADSDMPDDDQGEMFNFIKLMK